MRSGRKPRLSTPSPGWRAIPHCCHPPSVNIITANLDELTLLGTEEEDEQPSGPVKTVDKSLPRTTKRNAEPQAPIKPAGFTGTRRTGPGGNEGGKSFITRQGCHATSFSHELMWHTLAFRDRNAGSSANQRRATDEVPRGSQRGGRGARERGGE